MATRETTGEIDSAAAEWAARLDRGPLSADEQREVETWSAADPRRAGALARALAVLAHFERARALGAQVEPVIEAARPRRTPHRRAWLAGGAIAAGLATVAVLGPGAGLGALADLAPPWLGGPREFATARGEVRSIPLEDGSAVWLNTDSRVRIRYGATRRGVTLLAGEALFDVAKDPARPFVVAAQTVDVRAVGTSFSVSRLPGQPVEVLVREGVVQLDRPRGAPTPALRLTAGGRALARDNGAVVATQPGPAAVSRALSWRAGLLDFEGATLAEAAQTFARYSDLPIVIDDPEVAQRSITGLFASTDPAGFAHAAALSLNLRAHTSDGAIHLSR